MKKSILFLTFFLSAVLLARGSDLKEINLNFNASDFSFCQENGAYSISSEKFPVVFDTDTLAPALPYFLVNVLIAPNQEFQGLTINGGENLLRADIHITPNKLPVPTNALETEVPNHIISYALTSYPSEEVRYVSTSTLGNYKYVALLVCPLRYDAQQHALFIRQNLTISLSLRTANSPSMLAAFPQSESYQAKKRSEINQLVYNTEDIETLYPTTQHGTLTDAYPTKYLVITNEALKPAFQRLANWKTTKGVKSKVLTMEEINQKYNDSIVPLRIKRAIMEYKGQLEYVLLGGDVEIVPSLKCKLDTISLSPTEDVPVDFYYVSFSDLNWDKNHNGYYAEDGQDGDNVNATIDAAISRLSVNCLSDATDMVNRLISYEKSPKESMISDKMLMSGFMLKKAQENGEALYKYNIKPYWKGKMLRFYETKTDFEGDTLYRVNPDNLQSQLSNGYLFFDMMCHGWKQQWGHLYRWSSYMLSQAQQLQNKGYTFITTLSCYVNCFDTKPDSLCLGEGFMLNKNSNVLAFIGNCREGWYSRYGGGPSVNLFNQFYLGIMKYKMSIGEAVSFAKNHYMSFFNQKASRLGWVIRALNPLADPEMHPYLQKPKRFDYTQINYNNGLLSIESAEDSCQICLSKIENNNLVYYKIVDFDKSINIKDIPNGVTVCITKYGYVPYCLYILNGETVYLQNKDIDFNATITGTDIIAGSDVVNTRPKGAVTINSGQTFLEASNHIFIKNDFKVAKGAAMKINLK